MGTIGTWDPKRELNFLSLIPISRPIFDVQIFSFVNILNSVNIPKNIPIISSVPYNIIMKL